MNQKFRIATALAIAVVSVAFIAAVIVWAGAAYPPAEPALQAMNSDSIVFVSAENSWVVFHPAENPRPETGLIFYPGANVDYRAYAPVLKLIAADGYFVVLTPMPLNLAFFDDNAAARAQAEYPEIRNWFMSGHSLGGVAASSYAANHLEIRGVVLWASYPADESLKNSEKPVLSIYGTNDGLVTRDQLDASRELLPADAQFIPIEGGNHSQFGSYGLQEGDLEATISPEEQWDQAARATVEFIAGVLK